MDSQIIRLDPAFRQLSNTSEAFFINFKHFCLIVCVVAVSFYNNVFFCLLFKKKTKRNI